MLGFAASAAAGTAASNWALRASEAFAHPKPWFAPLNQAPPWNWFVPDFVILLKIRPPFCRSADPPPPVWIFVYSDLHPTRYIGDPAPLPCRADSSLPSMKC